jgi:hypothetical protein
MIENAFSTRGLAHPIPPVIPISFTSFRLFFSKKTATPHPPYPVDPVFCPRFSSNKLNINCLHFQPIYQSVTANRQFCPLFDPKSALSVQNTSLFACFRSYFFQSCSNSIPLPEP